MDEAHRAEYSDNAVAAEGHWLVLGPPNSPTIRVDARILDRILAEGSDLFLDANDVTTALMARNARQIAEKLSPYTRSAPIVLPEVYAEAKRRFGVARGLLPDSPPPAMLFGDEPVRAIADLLHVGTLRLRISQVAEYARVGANMPLPQGKLQAALAMLVIGDRRRLEDPEVLARKISEYEEWKFSNE